GASNRGDDRPPPERAALCDAAEHHEGEEEAARRREARRARRRCRAAPCNAQGRRAAEAQGRRSRRRCFAARRQAAQRGQGHFVGGGIVMAILLVADHESSSLHGATLNAVTAARKIGGDITVLVAGHDAAAAAQAAAKVPGVAKVLHADAPYLANPTAENAAATVVAVAKAGRYSHAIAPATGFG